MVFVFKQTFQIKYFYTITFYDVKIEMLKLVWHRKKKTQIAKCTELYLILVIKRSLLMHLKIRPIAKIISQVSM